MILAHHLIFGAYGFWLPNDPRGSWSTFVGSDALFLAGGPATTTDERRSLAKDTHDRSARLKVKDSLLREPVKFDETQRVTIGHGFREYVRKSGLKAWACAIMPDHVHMVYEQFRVHCKQVANLLKGRATRALIAMNVHPFRHELIDGKVPACFAQGQWNVFLDSEVRILKTIDYVRKNPTEIGLPEQNWDFVTPYNL